MKIFVTGGGSGGHIFPALEIIKALKTQKIDSALIGNKNSKEEEFAKKNHIDFIPLHSQKFVGKNLLQKIATLFNLVLSVLKGTIILLKEKPHAVIGVGGYVSAPIILACFLLRKKCFICEQNVEPGLANRLLARFCHGIFASFDESKKYFPKKTPFFVTGNPVKDDFFALKKSFPVVSKEFHILICGGSLGASYLNLNLPKSLALAQKKASHMDFIITHQTGYKDMDKVKSLYAASGLVARVTNFIENMPEAFLTHDLVISRSGATTCAEMAASGMPSILVPYPYAKGHQKKNALAMMKKEASLLVEQSKKFTEEIYAQTVKLANSPELLEKMSTNAKSLAKPSAALLIASLTQKLITCSNGTVSSPSLRG